MQLRTLFIVVFGLFFNATAFADTTLETPAELYYPTVNTTAGNPDGKVTIVEFYDYNCHYCRELVPIINDVLKKNPDVRVVFRDYPMLGPSSIVAAENAISAQQQGKYLALQTLLLNSKQPLDSVVIMQYAKQTGINTKQLEQATFSYLTQQQLRENAQFAKDLEIDGVPTLFVAMTPMSTQQMPVDAYKLVSPTQKQLQAAIDLLK